MPAVIRQIAEGDAALLADFYNGLSMAAKQMFHPLGETTTLERCEEIVRDNTPDRDRNYDLVACDGGLIVGWSFLWSLQADAPTFGLAVSDSYRGLGLGSRLMDAVLECGCRRGLRKIALTVVCDNEKAFRMYERRGFVKELTFSGEDGLPYYRMTGKPGRTNGNGDRRE